MLVASIQMRTLSGAAALALLVLVVVVRPSGGGRVLGLFHFQGRSHWAMIEPLVQELARRGHDLTVLSHFPQKQPLPNYKDVSLVGSVPMVVNNFTVDFVRSVNIVFYMWRNTYDFCERLYDHHAIKDLLHSTEKFDLIIMQVFGADCFSGLIHHFGGTPVVAVTTSVMLPWSNTRMGSPDNPAYIPNYYLPYGSRMTFWERLVNAVVIVATSVGFEVFSSPLVDGLNRRHFGDQIPKSRELVARTNLMLVNSHYSVNHPRPFAPNVVEVGGMHIPRATKQLPEDLQQFLDDSPDDLGTVLFTFGSLVRTETMPRPALGAFVAAFQRLAPQRFIWKVDVAALNAMGFTLPNNVYASTWLPQFDVLSHPKTRAFISHGGLMGSLEAVHCGVPVLGIPLFADQKLNVPNMVRHGVAVQMDIDAVTEDGLVHSLRQLTSPGSRYGARMHELLLQFRDRPRTPLEEAVSWTEYVLRHRGAAHLRPASLDLQWFQLLLLDVAALLLAGCAGTVVLAWAAVKGVRVLLKPQEGKLRPMGNGMAIKTKKKKKV